MPPPLHRLLTLPTYQIGSLLAEGWAAFRGEQAHMDVPPMEPSLRSVGEAVIDRSFSIGMNLLLGMPSASEMRRARREAIAARDIARAEGWIDDPRAFHGDPEPFAAEEVEAEPARAFVGTGVQHYVDLSVESGYAPPPALPGSERWLANAPNRRAHAYVLEHEEPGRPWLVCLHGFGMGTPIANFPGFNVQRLHAELGLNLLFPTLPLHGPRGESGVSGADLLSPDYVPMLHVFAQGVWDVRRWIGWLRNREGRAAKIGLYGVSLGGYTSALVGAFDGDLDCLVAGIPPTDFPNVARDNEPWAVRNADPGFHVDWQVIRELTHMVSPLAFEPKVPADRRFIYAGIADRVVRPDQARALWRHWDRPPIHWYPGGHVMAQFKESVYDFVEDALRRCELLPPRTTEKPRRAARSSSRSDSSSASAKRRRSGSRS